jgi:hypothetical protein
VCSSLCRMLPQFAAAVCQRLSERVIAAVGRSDGGGSFALRADLGRTAGTANAGWEERAATQGQGVPLLTRADVYRLLVATSPRRG